MGARLSTENKANLAKARELRNVATGKLRTTLNSYIANVQKLNNTNKNNINKYRPLLTNVYATEIRNAVSNLVFASRKSLRAAQNANKLKANAATARTTANAAKAAAAKVKANTNAAAKAQAAANAAARAAAAKAKAEANAANLIQKDALTAKNLNRIMAVVLQGAKTPANRVALYQAKRPANKRKQNENANKLRTLLGPRYKNIWSAIPLNLGPVPSAGPLGPSTSVKPKQPIENLRNAMLPIEKSQNFNSKSLNELLDIYTNITTALDALTAARNNQNPAFSSNVSKAKAFQTAIMYKRLQDLIKNFQDPNINTVYQGKNLNKLNANISRTLGALNKSQPGYTSNAANKAKLIMKKIAALKGGATTPPPPPPPVSMGGVTRAQELLFSTVFSKYNNNAKVRSIRTVPGTFVASRELTAAARNVGKSKNQNVQNALARISKHRKALHVTEMANRSVTSRSDPALTRKVNVAGTTYKVQITKRPSNTNWSMTNVIARNVFNISNTSTNNPKVTLKS